MSGRARVRRTLLVGNVREDLVSFAPGVLLAHTMMRAALLVAAGCGLQLAHPDGDGLSPGDAGSSSLVADAAVDAIAIDAPVVKPACADGVQDGQETDVDCGGPSCRKCVGGKQCGSPSDCFSGNCAAGTCFELATVSFADAVSYEASFKPYALMAGDLDGDGDIDLAAANEEASTIVWFRNAGNGVFTRVSGASDNGFPTDDYPTGGAIADMNGDGIPDVLTANYHGNSVSVLLGSGTGAAYTLGAAASYATAAGAETSNLAVGDLDGDGVLDVVATNPMANSFSVFLGRGDGTLQQAIDVPLTNPAYPPQPYSVAIADFDGDGIADVAVADDANLEVVIRLGNGDGTFRAGAQPKIGGMASFILVAHDMDLDGHLDLVVANRSSDDVSVLLGRGDGTFHAAIVSSISPSVGPYSLAVTDFNLDGIPDVVTSNFMTSNATVLLGDGTGNFAAPIDTGVTGQFSYGVAAGDFNGDGKPDFATANAAADDVAVKMSTAH